jgi:8-amino-7-oxononanoate synthase
MPFDIQIKKQQGLFRERMLRSGEACDFSSNDYLSLSLDSRVQAAYQRAFSTYPAGSGGSMLIGGYHDVHHRLEKTMCEALEADDAVLFASGYAANLGVMALLAESKIMAVFDKAVHASIYDGLKLAGTQYQRYAHQAYGALKDKLQSISNSNSSVLITESVFSMGGHFTPLNELAAFTKHLQGLVVDEAHAFGIYGKQGLGSVVHFGLTQAQVPLRMISFGKALNAQGAMVVGQRDWIEALIQVSRGYVYSTGMSPAYSSGLMDVFKMVRQADEARSQLFDNVSHFRQLVKCSKLNWGDSDTPIQHLYLGCASQALVLAQSLMNQGIYCRAIRPPTVPAKEAGIRVVLNAAHTHHQLERLMTTLETSCAH